MLNEHKKGEQTTVQKNIVEKRTDYPHFENEFGYLEADTIVGIIIRVL